MSAATGASAGPEAEPGAGAGAGNRWTVSSPFLRSLIAGAVAGTTTDLALFPLDTLKTRLQSSAGFAAAGGFSALYKGVGSAFVGAAPGAAAFFVGYDSTIRLLTSLLPPAAGQGPAQGPERGSAQSAASQVAIPLVAGSVGELTACAIRVPTEVCKQRTQAGQFASSAAALGDILRNAPARAAAAGTRASTSPAAAIFSELYRGWSATVLREVPFSMIQFPIWEASKAFWLRREQAQHRRDRRAGPAPDRVSVLASAVAGVLSGSLAAALTTPLDVLKTRIMLAPSGPVAATATATATARTRTGTPRLADLAKEVYGQHGWKGFFAGVGPRVAWIGGGGFVFLGSYQWAANAMSGGRAGLTSDEDDL